MEPVRERMRADLTAALRERDRAAIVALRTALAAVANGEAVPASDKYQEPVVGQFNEAARRHLTDGDILQILRSEAAERRAAIDAYETLGRHAEAIRLRAELAVLDRYLG